MATPEFISLIEQKARTLESIPEKFLSGVRRSEREIFREVLDLLNQMEQKAGRFVASDANILLASQVNERLKQIMVRSEFGRALDEFARGFDFQANLNLEYFSKAFELTDMSATVAAILDTSKRNAIDLLINRSADSEFIYPLRDLIEQSVVNNSRYSDTLKSIQDFIEGTEGKESRLMSYSRGIAHDTFAVADRAITSSFSDEIDAEWFLYAGALIRTSRDFCRERHDQFFYYKEIEAWGAGEKTSGLSLPDKSGNWNGKYEGTNESTIWSYLGGYNCGHTPMPVSIFSVPIAVIQRNIAQGFFDPTEKEVELLGI